MPALSLPTPDWRCLLKVALLGDVMLGRGVAEELRVRSPESLWSPNLRELTLGCDLVLCNLECCISQRGRRTDVIAGKAFFFGGPPVAIESLRALGVSAVSLANVRRAGARRHDRSA